MTKIPKLSPRTASLGSSASRKVAARVLAAISVASLAACGSAGDDEAGPVDSTSAADTTTEAEPTTTSADPTTSSSGPSTVASTTPPPTTTLPTTTTDPAPATTAAPPTTAAATTAAPATTTAPTTTVAPSEPLTLDSFFIPEVEAAGFEAIGCYMTSNERPDDDPVFFSGFDGAIIVIDGTTITLGNSTSDGDAVIPDLDVGLT